MVTGVMLAYRCSECGRPAAIRDPSLCPRTGRLAQPQPVVSRRTRPRPADPFGLDRSQRARRRRKRKPQTLEWREALPQPDE